MFVRMHQCILRETSKSVSLIICDYEYLCSFTYMVIQIGAFTALEFGTQAPSQICLGFQHFLEFDIFYLLPIEFRDFTYGERRESVPECHRQSISSACLFEPLRSKILIPAWRAPFPFHFGRSKERPHWSRMFNIKK